jgi:hypothetical protein
MPSTSKNLYPIEWFTRNMGYYNSQSCCHIIEVGGYSKFLSFICDENYDELVRAMTYPALTAGHKTMVAYFPSNKPYGKLIKALTDFGWCKLPLGKSNSSDQYDCIALLHPAPTKEEYVDWAKEHPGMKWSRAWFHGEKIKEWTKELTQKSKDLGYPIKLNEPLY